MTTDLQLPDVNVLVALTNSSHVHHRRAHAWWPTAERWATTAITESAFIRLMLNPAVTGRPFGAGQVLSVLEGLRAQPGHAFLDDGSTLAAPRVDLAGLRGPQQVTDFHLVNLAASVGAVLVTLDARIPKTLGRSDQRHCLLI